MKIYLNSLIILLAGFLSSCGQEEHEPYDHPFIHIMYNEGSFVEIDSEAIAIGEYSVYLSSKPLKQNLEVVYEIIVGDGLTEGVDFDIINQGNKLTFLPGIYDMPIRIQWKNHRLPDTTKDNTLKIVLISNNQGFTMGLPGPDQLQKSLIITKINK